MNKKRFLGFILTLMLLVVVAVPPVSAAYYKQRMFQRLSGGPFTAGESISCGEVVTIKDADGKVYKADANDAALRPALGLAGANASASGYVEVVLSGIFTGWTGLTEGAMGYLSETAGAITQTAPTWTQAVAFAISTTQYFVVVQDTTADIKSLGVLTGATPISLEGATDDDFETTFSVTDPTADRTLKLPDASGRMIIGPDSGSTDNQVVRFDSTTGYVIQGSVMVIDDNGDVTGLQDSIEFEGSSADDFETTLSIINPTADRTVKVGDVGGRVQVGPDGASTDNTVPRYDGVTGYLFQASGVVIDDNNDVTGIQDLIQMEGATADDYESNLRCRDVGSDIDLYLPEYDGDIASVVAEDYADYTQSGVGTTSTTSITVPANVMATAGRCLRVRVWGEHTNANAAKTVHLYIDNANICSVAVTPTDTGDWYATFDCISAGSAVQRVGGFCCAYDDATSVYAADTTDATSSFTFKVQIQAAHAADVIIQRMCTIEFLP